MRTYPNRYVQCTQGQIIAIALMYAWVLQITHNPPYQDDRQGDSTTALPVYHYFMEAAYQVGSAVELITPARFLFNAGRTPKKWNEQMLNDSHLSVLKYEGDGSAVFPNTEIKGGVVITYWDVNKSHHPIGVFTIYPELNAILKRMPVLLPRR